MSNQNSNTEACGTDHITNHLEVIPIYNKDKLEICQLYGMTLEQYREGAEIHSRCFSEVQKLTELYFTIN